MEITALLSAQVLTASGQTAAFEVPPQALPGQTEISLEVEATAVSGTTPSATFSLQWSDDGTDWDTPSPAQSLTAITAVGNAVESFTVQGVYYRLAYVISGTTPSFTVTARAVTE